MADVKESTKAAEGGPRDPTFRNYKADDAKAYAAYRPAYPEQQIQMIIDRHVSTGGQTNTVLDIGCGPGLATRQIAPFFQHVVGADPGESMISVARSMPITSASGEPARFEVCSAEELHTIMPPASVDLITAATCAHWFEMPNFFASATKVLKPGGSIIIWGSGGLFCDPETTPNAAEIQRLWTRTDEHVLAPYELSGNKLTRTLYRDLVMPWTAETTDPEMKAALETFDKSKSSRETINEDGIRDDRFENGYLMHRKTTIEQAKKVLGTISPVTRWREAHKEQLEKGEVEDVVDHMMRISAEIMAKGSEGKTDVKEVSFILGTVIIMVKKKAA